MFILINAFAVLYLAALWLAGKTAIDWPAALLGLGLLFGVLPYNVTRLFKLKLATITEYAGFSLLFFFFVYTPLLFLVNYFAHVPLTILLIVITYVITAVLAAGAMAWRKESFTSTLPFSRSALGSMLRDNWPFLLVVAMFIVIHVINFWFYRFIPEWDGYTDLKKINETLASGFITVEYRSFFNMAMSLIARATQLNPYDVFIFVMVALQSTVLMVLNQLLREYKIRDHGLRLIVLLGVLGIPVLALETDMTRPQNVVLIGLPLYVFFLYRALKEKAVVYWVLTSLIALAGINYHEFFLFVFVAHAGWLLWLLFDRFYRRAQDTRDRAIFGLIIALGVCLVTRSKAIMALLGTVGIIFKNISHVSAWRIWFLGSYNTDGANLDLGWAGLSGAIKYYAYYLSPIAGIWLVVFIAFLIWQRPKLIKDTLIRAILPLLVLFIAFAEILPRLNFVLLPERFWVLISLLLAFAAIPLSQLVLENKSAALKKTIVIGLLLAIGVGIGGSLYIASSKKALTTQEEYQAVDWIKANTPADAVFISQAANGPMVEYFAQRKIVSPNEEFFMSPTVESAELDERLQSMEKSLNETQYEILVEVNHYLQGRASLNSLNMTLHELDSPLQQEKKEINKLEKLLAAPKYILYSTNKFKGIYAQRNWWLLANYYGAHVEKFTAQYPVVYDRDGVTIWEVK